LVKLEKQLGLIDVFSVASGAMISSGLFVLPAIAYAKTGPAIVLSYILASILILPSVFSKAELSTAMPKAGGTYFFVERSMGPLWGLFSGLATWFSVALKSAFAIVGMAIFVKVVTKTIASVELTEWQLKVIAVFCCAAFTFLNIYSVKHTSRFQVILVFALLIILTCFVALGMNNIDLAHYKGFFGEGWRSILATAGLVFISFGGLTKVASIAEEVKKPNKNLPLGMFLAWFIVTIFYITVITVTVGTIDGETLSTSGLPISQAANTFMGRAGFVILGLAAIAAFVTTANGGILAASRSPLAMSRDKLLPPSLAHINKKFKTPHTSIILTSGFMMASIVFLDIELLVKTASTLMIILFILDNVSVIIMRESKIQSYRPKFKSPLYPYMHIAAIVAYAALIVDMGAVPLLITAGFIALSVVWYFIYIRRKITRASAAMHIVERVTDHELKTVTLENELRDILLERDEVIEDRFDRLIKDCDILDTKETCTSEDIFRIVSKKLEQPLNISEYVLFEKFLHRETEGGTIVQPGLAIPHIVVEGKNKFDIMLVRARKGIIFPNAPVPVKIMFILAGSRDERNYHLRALMAIAQIAQEKGFEQRWLQARDTQAIRNLLLLSTRTRDRNDQNSLNT